MFDKNISAGVDIYRRDYNNGYYNRASATYDSATTGFQMRAGVPLSEYMSIIGRYTFNHENITIDENTFFGDIDGDGIRECEPLLAGRYLCEAIGTRTSSTSRPSAVNAVKNCSLCSIGQRRSASP